VRAPSLGHIDGGADVLERVSSGIEPIGAEVPRELATMPDLSAEESGEGRSRARQHERVDGTVSAPA
jgi:hypothetical protein